MRRPVKVKNMEKIGRITFYTSFLLINLFYISFVSFAADINLTPPGIGGAIDPSTGNPIPGTPATTPDFIEYLDWLYKILLGSTGILALIIIVAGGIMYVLAGASGKPQDITQARTMILSAIAGLLLALGSWIILNTINPDLLKKGLDLNKY